MSRAHRALMGTYGTTYGRIDRRIDAFDALAQVDHGAYRNHGNNGENKRVFHHGLAFALSVTHGL
jgi:hypothetical protein